MLGVPLLAVSLDAGEAAADGPWLGLTLLLPDANTALSGRLLLPEAVETRLTAALRDVPPGRAALPEDLTVPVSVRIGALTLSLGQLAALRPGDGLLFDAAPFARGEALALAAGAQGWTLRATPRGYEAASPRRRAGTLGREDWTDMPSDAAEAPLDELPVRIVFEVGRLDLPLGEVASAGVGHLFALPRAPGDAMVDILANGRRYGRGEIVQVGDGAFAVRVLSLLPKATP